MSDNKPKRKGERGPMSVSIKTSYNLPPPAVIQHDIEQLRVERRRCVDAIQTNDKSVEEQRDEQKELLELVDNPGHYNPDACAAAADRCEKHIDMFNSLNKKEYAKIDQFDSMIATLEKRLCLSEQTSR